MAHPGGVTSLAHGEQITSDDFPGPDPEWGRTNLICTGTGPGTVAITHQPLSQMPPELAEIFEEVS